MMKVKPFAVKTLGTGDASKVYNREANKKAKKAEWAIPFSHVHIFLHSTICFRAPGSYFPQFVGYHFLMISASYNNRELTFKTLQLYLRRERTTRKSNYGCGFGGRRLPKFIVEFQNTRKCHRKALGRSCCTQQTGDEDGNPVYICSLWHSPAYCWTSILVRPSISPLKHENSGTHTLDVARI